MPFILITTSKMTSDEDMDEDPPRGECGGETKSRKPRGACGLRWRVGAPARGAPRAGAPRGRPRCPDPGSFRVFPPHPTTAAARVFQPASTRWRMEAACTEAMRQPGVIGVMCVDGQGLCLQSQGEVPEVSGCVAEIASQAQVLCQGDEGAVVSVESAERKVLLSRVSGVTTAVFMRPSGVA